MPVEGQSARRTRAASLWSGATWAGLTLMIGTMCNPAISLEAPAWLELRQHNACEAMKDQYCLGRFGFAIKPDGSFITGPSGSGRRVKGRLGRAELRRLNILIASTAATIAVGQTQCEAGGLVGIRDQLDIDFKNGPPVQLYNLGGKVGTLCVSGAKDRVDKLHSYVRVLMTRYYRVPFPAQ